MPLPVSAKTTCVVSSIVNDYYRNYYLYDNNKRVIKQVDTTAFGPDTTIYSYNSAGQVTKLYIKTTNNSNSQYFDYQWGTNSLSLHQHYMDKTVSGVESEKIVVQFTNGTQIKRIADYTNYETRGIVLNKYSDFSYDANGNFTKVVYTDSTGAVTGSMVIEYDNRPNPFQAVPVYYYNAESLIFSCPNNFTKITRYDNAGNPAVSNYTHTFDSDKKLIEYDLPGCWKTKVNYMCK